MKKYINPTVDILSYLAKDVIMVSGDDPENKDMLVDGSGLWG